MKASEETLFSLDSETSPRLAGPFRRRWRVKGLAIVVIVISLGFADASLVSAQFMFLDADGDGTSSPADKVAATGSMAVEIWIRTDTDRDGSPSPYKAPGNRPLTINYYEFVLRSIGGTVEWGTYTNLQPTMETPFGPLMNATEYYNGFGGLPPLPPGKYRLGRLSVKVKSGNPRLVFASSSSLWGSAGTSFGSQCSSRGGDNSLRYSEDVNSIEGPGVGVPGDWGDASGLAANEVAPQLASPSTATATQVFSTSISPNPANPEAILTIQTTRQGYLRVRLFDVSGRLISTLVDQRSAPPGVHIVRFNGYGQESQPASGVYLYRVESSEASTKGKIVILK